MSLDSVWASSIKFGSRENGNVCSATKLHTVAFKSAIRFASEEGANTVTVPQLQGWLVWVSGNLKAKDDLGLLHASPTIFDHCFHTATRCCTRCTKQHRERPLFEPIKKTCGSVSLVLKATPISTYFSVHNRHFSLRHLSPTCSFLHRIQRWRTEQKSTSCTMYTTTHTEVFKQTAVKRS